MPTKKERRRAVRRKLREVSPSRTTESVSDDSALPGVFYAFPSGPQHLVETLEAAIQSISEEGVVAAKSWRSLSISGKVVITEILKAIDKASVFACDLTYLNSNVLFELGYATGRSKRIWISRNRAIEQSQAIYSRLSRTLVPIGYAPYTNRMDLVTRFRIDAPWSDLKDGALRPESGESRPVRSANPSLLYLKSSVTNDASVALSELIQTAGLSELILDDPSEVPSQTLDWYLQKIRRSDAVVAHLLSDTHDDALWHNAKCSFVSGLALGMDREVLMLAHEPFDCPFDFQTLLLVHSTSVECRDFAETWLADLQERHSTQVSQQTVETRSRGKATAIRNLSVGDEVAENEESKLAEYFVETAAYLSLIRGEGSLFVGRKGTGKTATLYAASEQIRRDRRNHVCVIKPVGYEVDGLLRVLRQAIPKSEKGFLVESLWKFLLYTELARSVLDEIKSHPVHYARSSEENELVNYFDQNADILGTSFSIRLQTLVEGLTGLEDLQAGRDQRTRISEVLHQTVIVELRQILGGLLTG